MNSDSDLSGRGIQPLASLLAHPLLALAAAVLVLAVGLPMAWKKGEPRYQTEAALQVAPRYMRNLREDQELDFQSNTQYRQFVEHQRRSVGRYDVLRDALTSLGEQRTLWQRPDESERRAVERLRERLTVASVPDTYLLRIALEGARPRPTPTTAWSATCAPSCPMRASGAWTAMPRWPPSRHAATPMSARARCRTPCSTTRA